MINLGFSYVTTMITIHLNKNNDIYDVFYHGFLDFYVTFS
jgi:hypothetical protein